MLTPEEVLLFKSVEEEKQNQLLMQTGAALAGTTGAMIGSQLGRVPHNAGKVVNKGLDLVNPITRGDQVIPRSERYGRIKPGFRMAGGITGALLGGSLGAGVAALMKQNEAGRVLGRVQASGGEISPADEAIIGRILGEMYANPSAML